MSVPGAVFREASGGRRADEEGRAGGPRPWGGTSRAAEARASRALARRFATGPRSIFSLAAKLRAVSEPVTSIAHYRVRQGREDEFLRIIDGHWETLRTLELVTDRPPVVYLGTEKGIEGPLVIEIFEWVDADASAVAHTHPRISRTWESMGPLCEERGGRPPFEFPTMRRLTPG
jgi:hypothetical protein